MSKRIPKPGIKPPTYTGNRKSPSASGFDARASGRSKVRSSSPKPLVEVKNPKVSITALPVAYLFTKLC